MQTMMRRQCRAMQPKSAAAATALFGARFVSEHFRNTATPHPLGAQFKNAKPQKSTPEWGPSAASAVWTPEQIAGVQQTHRRVDGFVDAIAYAGVRVVRFLFDWISGYAFGAVTERKALRRILFLETIAGVPGMVGGSLRHLRSLRHMEKDHGWILTLLEEAENERVHMLTFYEYYRPSALFRAMVLVAQGITWNVFFLCYLVSPRLCHRFVGYLEQEAVKTYTTILHYMDSTDPKHASMRAFGQKPANGIAIEYWKLPATATMRDVVAVVRADEANHRDVNHTLASLKPDEANPYAH